MSLKDAGGESFEDAYGLLQSIISQLYVEHAYLEKCAEIDELIRKKEELITYLETYKKSLIYEYVTGKKEVQ